MRKEEARIVIDALANAADVIKRADDRLFQLYSTDSEGSQALSGFLTHIYTRINQLDVELWKQEERENEKER